MTTAGDSADPATAPAAPRPWGFWATLGLSLTAFAVYVLATGVVIVGVDIYGRIVHPEAERQVYSNILGTSGLVVCSAIIVAGLLGAATVLGFVRLRRGYPLKDYLCLRPASRRDTLVWFGALILFILLYHALAFAMEFQNPGALYSDLYETVRFPPLFFIALVVVPPLFEETLFRGFLFRGIAASRLGTVGAVLITSLTWAVVHAQYEAGLILIVFAIGILLGLARARSGSLYLTMLLHGAFNLVSVVELILFGMAS